jgi:hypothetical protein
LRRLDARRSHAYYIARSTIQRILSLRGKNSPIPLEKGRPDIVLYLPLEQILVVATSRGTILLYDAARASSEYREIVVNVIDIAYERESLNGGPAVFAVYIF